MDSNNKEGLIVLKYVMIAGVFISAGMTILKNFDGVEHTILAILFIVAGIGEGFIPLIFYKGE